MGKVFRFEVLVSGLWSLEEGSRRQLHRQCAAELWCGEVPDSAAPTEGEW